MARSLEEVVERFQREGICGGFASRRLEAIATFQRETMPKRRHAGMVWNMYVAEGQRGTGLAAALFHHVLEVASWEVDQVDLYVAVENDQFHLGGAEATADLAQLLAPLPAIHVLDVENVGTRLRDETADRDFWH